MTRTATTAFFLLTIMGTICEAQGNVDDELLARYERAALTSVGDAEAGSRIFFDQNKHKCSVCHRVGQRGGRVGPDLTKIGGKFDRTHLIESILEPSRQIVEGYRTTVLQLKNGLSRTGIVKETADHVITLLDAEGKTLQIQEADVESQSVSKTSLMPSGLAASLSEQDFVNLIAYLETLRSGKGKFGAGIKGPVQLPKGFQIETVATGLDGAVALEATADGRLLICEQPGSLRIVRDGKLLARPFVEVPATLNWERGLIGVTVAPDFPKDPWVYVCYVTARPFVHHVVSRFRADGDVAVPGSEQILLEGDDQSRMGGNVPAGHQGGGLHFGADGCLYVGLGEQTAGKPSQQLNMLLGKILRINPDGSIPDDNPLMDQTQGKYQSIYALGLRNPFTFAFNPRNGELLVNDVGGQFEEINRISAGANYGWPTIDHGPVSNSKYTGPIYIYPQASISGGDFVPDDNNWPERFKGRYLFADFVHGWIRSIDSQTADPARNKQSEAFLDGLRRPVDLRFAADGQLYVLLRNAWVVDDKFQGGTGSLVKISYVGQ